MSSSGDTKRPATACQILPARGWSRSKVDRQRLSGAIAERTPAGASSAASAVQPNARSANLRCIGEVSLEPLWDLRAQTFFDCRQQLAARKRFGQEGIGTQRQATHNQRRQRLQRNAAAWRSRTAVCGPALLCAADAWPKRGFLCGGFIDYSIRPHECVDLSGIAYARRRRIPFR